MFQRIITNNILSNLKKNNKVIVIYGARQVGKTTLINNLIKISNKKTIKINADLAQYNDLFSSRNLDLMKEVIDDNEMLFIDEAQNITDIGINLKILYDSLANLKIIVTGSSSFELANKRTFKLINNDNFLSFIL